MKTEDYSPTLKQLSDDFFEIYSPAENIPESTEKLTTEEIVERLKTNYPFPDLNVEWMYHQLTSNGFRSRAFGEKFVWLLKEK